MDSALRLKGSANVALARIKRLGWLSTVAAVGLLATAGIAMATPTVTVAAAYQENIGFGGTAPFTLLNLGTAGTGNAFQSSSGFSNDTITFGFSGGSPTGGLYAGNGSGFESPFSLANGSTDYLATGVGGTVTETFSTPQTALDLLWGSIDYSTQNQLAIVVDGYTITGATIEAADPSYLNPADNFSCNSGSCAAYVEITGLASFTQVTYTDLVGNVPNFEFVPGVPVTTATTVPEPASVAIFGAALFGVGFLGLRRRKKRRVAV